MFYSHYCFLRNTFIGNSTQISQRFKEPGSTRIIMDKEQTKKFSTQNCLSQEQPAYFLEGLIVFHKHKIENLVKLIQCIT